MNRTYTLWWLLALLLVLGVEAAALARSGSGDTLSEHVWRLAQRPIEGVLIFGTLAWLLVYHFPLARPGQRLGWPDALAFLLGAAWWLLSRRLAAP